MRVSQFYMPVLRETPAEARIVSHQLMLRAGMIKQGAAGIYNWLPLGFRVLKKIEQIVREEQNRAGAIEILMPTIQPADLWQESGRYEDYGKELLRITDRHERDMLYGPTNEEAVADIFRSGARSYKDLPRILYHIQWKFRDEIRPRFGIMRGREFLMKDAYSFDLDEESARKSYNRMFIAYLRTFARMGLKSIPMKADTGPIGGDLSHEFIVLADTGESEVFCHKDLIDMPTPSVDIDYTSDLTALIEQRTGLYAATDEMHDEAAFARLPDEKQIRARGIEVGHIFYFGQKYSKPMNCVVVDRDNKDSAVEMGSYGVGVSRLVGAIIEAHHDEHGCKWPIQVAPFQVGIINLKVGDDATDTACSGLYQALSEADIEILYDDTSARAGAKFARMDLIGLPYQVTIGPKGLKEGEIEVKNRLTGEKQSMGHDLVADYLISGIKAALQP